jgi:hypothetical protein
MLITMVFGKLTITRKFVEYGHLWILGFYGYGGRVVCFYPLYLNSEKVIFEASCVQIRCWRESMDQRGATARYSACRGVVPTCCIGRRVVCDSGGPGVGLWRLETYPEEEERIDSVSSVQSQDSRVAVCDDSSSSGQGC